MMIVAGTSAAGTLAFADSATKAKLSRQAKRGAAVRIGPGIYAVGATLPPAEVARQHRLDIVAHVWPGAVLCGHSALSGGLPVGGRLFVAHPDPPRVTPLRLAGLTIVPQQGPGILPGDTRLPDGIALAGRARTLTENVVARGRPPLSRAGTQAVEDRIDELARQGGAGAIQSVLDELDVIEGQFDPSQVEAVRRRLRAVLGTVSGGVRSERLAARLAGVPFDAQRLERLDEVLGRLADIAPQPRPAAGAAQRWEWQPFFEAYFSNFIEGTEFGVDEARRIVVDGVIPADRPADAHDVTATYRLVSDSEDRTRTPQDADELIELLSRRHAVLMAARQDKRPGQLKERSNYAGGYQFVTPDLVVGTLHRGLELLSQAVDPMLRAVGMMVLVTECHPFDDGNGRIARIMANAELSHAGQIRVVIPTSFRNNYIAALRAVSTGQGRGESLLSVLEFAQRWVAAVDWSSFADAHADVERSNAYLDPADAESSGRRLTLPPGSTP